MENVAESVNNNSSDSLQQQNCFYHPEITAWGICSHCGRDLCYECFLYYQRESFCQGCESRSPFVIDRVKSCLFNPAVILILIIGLFSVIYLAAQKGKLNIINKPSWEGGIAKGDAVLRTRLYLEKTLRLKMYADYLAETGRPDLAKRSYHRARLALEQLLPPPGKLTDTEAIDASARQYLTELFIVIAACYRGEQQASNAIETLNKSLEIELEPKTAGLSYYNLGRIYEEDLNDYDKAISMYKLARKAGSNHDDFIDYIIDMAAKPPHEKKISGMIRQLTGSYDPAEAQSRIINCYRKLGMEDKVTEEYKMLTTQHPFSSQAAEMREKTQEQEEEKDEEKTETENEKEDGTIKIVPWE